MRLRGLNNALVCFECSYIRMERSKAVFCRINSIKVVGFWILVIEDLSELRSGAFGLVAVVLSL